MLIAIRENSKISLNKNKILPLVHPELYIYKIMQLDAIDPKLKDSQPGEIPFNVALKIFLRALKKK